MEFGIYTSDVCKNSILKGVIDNKLEVNLEEHCAWCGKAHKFKLSEIGEDKTEPEKVGR